MVTFGVMPSSTTLRTSTPSGVPAHPPGRHREARRACRRRPRQLLGQLRLRRAMDRRPAGRRPGSRRRRRRRARRARARRCRRCRARRRRLGEPGGRALARPSARARGATSCEPRPAGRRSRCRCGPSPCTTELPSTWPAQAVSGARGGHREGRGTAGGCRTGTRATSARRGWSPATSAGSRLRSSRLVAAWVRTCTSSPIATACAARDITSTGAVLPRSASASTGPTASRRSTSRSIAPGESSPNQATSPEPCPSGAYAVHPGVCELDDPDRGGRPHHRGHRHDDAVLVGRREPAPRPTPSSASACVGRVGPALGDDGGAHRAAQRVAEPVELDRRAGSAAARWPSRSTGTTSRGRPHADEQRRAACPAGGAPRRWPRRRRAACGPNSRRSAATTSGHRRPGSASRPATTGRPCCGDRLGEQRQPDVDHADLVGDAHLGGSMPSLRRLPCRSRRRTRSRRRRAAPPRRPRTPARRCASTLDQRPPPRAGSRRPSPRRPAARHRRPAVRVSTMRRGSSTSVRSRPVSPSGRPVYSTRGRVEHGAVQVDAAQPVATGLADRDADDLVGGAVVELAGLHDVLGEVGRLAEARLQRRPHPVRC